MNTQDFLLELGCDELPAKNLLSVVKSLANAIETCLNEANLPFDRVDYFATPRRLAVRVNGLASEQASQWVERQGPSVDAAFDKNGSPSLACLGFARSCGVSTADLSIKDTDNGQRVVCRIKQVGRQTMALLAERVPELIYKLPLAKPMRWGTETRAFVRPVQWVVALYGNDIIEMELFHRQAGRHTYGHRFHHPGRLTLNHPRDYVTVLKEQGNVLVDLDERKTSLLKQIEAQSLPYGRALVDEKLCDEVLGLVEWPVVLIGRFNPDFLAVPPEALISSIKNHQKSFPIVDRDGLLAPYFVIVSNLESKNPKMIIQGNERVVNARLADAAFFYHQDTQKPLNHFVERLEHVLFQKDLGSLAQRCERLAVLLDYLAEPLKLNTKQAQRAAQLAKFDLMTDMVGEFPELQGVMGYYYAKQAKEAEPVARAIQEHYYPRFSQDRLPKELLSAALALVDRVDLITGIIGVNLLPTGDKDPYALRRAAQGVLRILIEKRLSLNLRDLLMQAAKNYPQLANTQVVDQALQFILERLRSWYLEQGISADVFAAVASLKCDSPLDFDQRIQAVQAFQTLAESSALAAANKRVSNILKKSAGDIDHTKRHEINPQLFEHESERILAQLIQQKRQQVDTLYQAANYTAALTSLASLKAPVDDFFEHVMIMVDNPSVRDNRIALLIELRHLFTQVADISQLHA
jgi:glycyl-tRNA synthetase beta chain